MAGNHCRQPGARQCLCSSRGCLRPCTASRLPGQSVCLLPAPPPECNHRRTHLRSRFAVTRPIATSASGASRRRCDRSMTTLPCASCCTAATSRAAANRARTSGCSGGWRSSRSRAPRSFTAPATTNGPTATAPAPAASIRSNGCCAARVCIWRSASRLIRDSAPPALAVEIESERSLVSRLQGDGATDAVGGPPASMSGALLRVRWIAKHLADTAAGTRHLRKHGLTPPGRLIGQR
jgi:hypothetical protein